MTTVRQPRPSEIVSAIASSVSSSSRSPCTSDAMSSNGTSRASGSSAGGAAAVPLESKIKAAWNDRSGSPPTAETTAAAPYGADPLPQISRNQVTPVTPKKGVPASDGDQLFESLGVVERADQRQVQRTAADHVPGDPLDVLGGDRVERRDHLVRLGRFAFEHLATQPEEDQPLRVLELEDEASLREVARLLKLLRRHGLVDDALELVDDRRHRLVDAVDVDAGLRVERAGVRVT